MNKWYLCTVAYERQGDETGLRKVSESYLVDALSFTEAEERIIKEVTPFVSCGALEVVNIRPMRLADMLISNNGSNYYRGKVNLITLDASSGQERKTSVAMVVREDSLLSAATLLESHLSESLFSYEIVSIADLGILDVYQYVAPKETDV